MLDCVEKLSDKKIFLMTKVIFLNGNLRECFSTFFGPRHPYLVLNLFGGTPSLSNDQGIVTTDGISGTSSWHPKCVAAPQLVTKYHDLNLLGHPINEGPGDGKIRIHSRWRMNIF